MNYHQGCLLVIIVTLYLLCKTFIIHKVSFVIIVKILLHCETCINLKVALVVVITKVPFLSETNMLVSFATCFPSEDVFFVKHKLSSGCHLLIIITEIHFLYVPFGIILRVAFIRTIIFSCLLSFHLVIP